MEGSGEGSDRRQTVAMAKEDDGENREDAAGFTAAADRTERTDRTNRRALSTYQGDPESLGLPQTDLPRRTLDYDRERYYDDKFLEEFFSELEEEDEPDPRQRYVIRFRYKGVEADKLTEEYTIGTLVLNILAAPPSGLSDRVKEKCDSLRQKQYFLENKRALILWDRDTRGEKEALEERLQDQTTAETGTETGMEAERETGEVMEFLEQEQEHQKAEQQKAGKSGAESKESVQDMAQGDNGDISDPVQEAEERDSLTTIQELLISEDAVALDGMVDMAIAEGSALTGSTDGTSSLPGTEETIPLEDNGTGDLPPNQEEFLLKCQYRQYPPPFKLPDGEDPGESGPSLTTIGKATPPSLQEGVGQHEQHNHQEQGEQRECREGCDRGHDREHGRETESGKEMETGSPGSPATSSTVSTDA
ncbi:UNVERIFIED_CONTAM: hypothetical protein K2H54_040022 [Gekko kuhli]